FPTLAGSLVGLAIVVTAAKKGFLMPPREECWDFAPADRWDKEWTGSIEIRDVGRQGGKLSLALAWSPYVLVSLLLVLTRVRIFPFGEWLRAWTLRFPNILGTGISASLEPLYLPGTVFIVAAAATLLLHRMRPAAFGRAVAS